MIEREATSLAYKAGLVPFMNTKFVNVAFNKGNLYDIDLSITINNQTINTPLSDADFFMSLDDFADKIINPLVLYLTRQDRDLMFLGLECS